MISAVIIYKDNKVSVHSAETEVVSKVWPAGFYEADTDSNGNIHIRKETLHELHKPFTSTGNEIILTTVKNFYEKGVKERIEQLGFLHKLGILLHGRQGCGKTSLIAYISQQIIEKNDGVVFFCNSMNNLDTAIRLAKQIRQIQNNPIVFIADEFERYAINYESDIKNFLDGKDSISNMLFLGATNYLERIPKTLRERPSRFKIVQELEGISDKKEMRRILKETSDKISPNLFSNAEINEVTKNLHNATIDELKHICLDKATNTYVSDKYVKKTIGFKLPEVAEEEVVDKEETPLDSKFVTIKFKTLDFIPQKSNDRI